MSIKTIKIFNQKSLLNRRWKLKKFEERNAIYLSQRFNYKFIVAKLLSIRGIHSESVENFINPRINDNIPIDNPITKAPSVPIKSREEK